MDNEKLANAIRLIQEGKKWEGATILSNLLTLEPNIELAWLWLHVCMESKERKIYCLQRALEINPGRMEAREALDRLLSEEPNSENSYTPAVGDQPNPVFQSTQVESAVQKSQALKDEYPPQTEISQPKSDITVEQHRKPGKISQPRSDKTKERAPKHNKISPPKKKRFEEQRQQLEKNRPIRELKEVKNKSRRQLHETGQIRHPIVIPNKEPTVILIRPEDNLFAIDPKGTAKFPKIDTGIYDNTLFVDEVRINPTHMPRCLEIGFMLDGEKCDFCDFFSASDCAFKDDPELFDVAKLFIVGARRRYIEYQKRQKSVIRAIYLELKAHGRPLHYSVLTQIVTKRNPQLSLTENNVLKTMSAHPEFFINVSEGVYQCKKNKR